jgi:pyrimidine deaminase RibD-like protein
MVSQEVHIGFLRHALEQAKRSPPKPTNFRVGCLIVSYENESSPEILATGYTLELPGNTHAEQSALDKLAAINSGVASDLPQILTPQLNTTLYTTLEPCGKRLSGNTPCVQRIIATRADDPRAGVRKVVFGAKEPGTFVQDSQSCQLLTEANVDWEYIPEIEQQILQIAMEGHQQQPKSETQPPTSSTGTAQAQIHPAENQETNVDNISPDERQRQEEQPRNPKKRMMEI